MGSVLQIQRMEEGRVDAIPVLNMLTINKAYERIKSEDPQTVVTRNFIRKSCESGEVFSRKSGNRCYVDFTDLRRFLTPPKYLEKYQF